MSVVLLPRLARAGHLRAKFRSVRERAKPVAVRALRGLLRWYLDNSHYSYCCPDLRRMYEVRLWLRRRAIALLKRLPGPAPRRRRVPASLDLEALVQRQYGWRNANHSRREGRRHAAQ
ncbi:hypothetical protein [Stenotrophomonas sp. PS02289]|uniref:hypothetical protein n=1 Tax=Stenotrophomonas sp. PS02289 TaxID=2991422 RepID=UPI00249C035C|nr:hypothetical protein [Stenotrophomonas sp. PS02289]